MYAQHFWPLSRAPYENWDEIFSEFLITSIIQIECLRKTFRILIIDFLGAPANICQHILDIESRVFRGKWDLIEPFPDWKFPPTNIGNKICASRKELNNLKSDPERQWERERGREKKRKREREGGDDNGEKSLLNRIRIALQARGNGKRWNIQYKW